MYFFVIFFCLVLLVENQLCTLILSLVCFVLLGFYYCFYLFCKNSLTFFSYLQNEIYFCNSVLLNKIIINLVDNIYFLDKVLILLIDLFLWLDMVRFYNCRFVCLFLILFVCCLYCGCVINRAVFFGCGLLYVLLGFTLFGLNRRFFVSICFLCCIVRVSFIFVFHTFFVYLNNINILIRHLRSSWSPFFLCFLLCLLERLTLLIRPITLSFRIRINIVAGHLIFDFIILFCFLFVGSFVWGFGVGFILFESFVCLVQSFVYLLLYSLYFLD